MWTNSSNLQQILWIDGVVELVAFSWFWCHTREIGLTGKTVVVRLVFDSAGKMFIRKINYSNDVSRRYGLGYIFSMDLFQEVLRKS